MSRSSRSGESALAAKIAALRPGHEPVKTTLKTSGRVLRRVTDGIYREPWAALRELISNAYDADSTKVEIITDPPWFRRITVRDDGNGFSRESLASALENIGGSPKRTGAGVTLGVTAKHDSSQSPGGRRLIGKLGIGLFAISHLSQQFKIITKSKNEKYRTVADVVLAKYAEENKTSEADVDDEIHTAGEVSIFCVPADDVNAHGTEIIIEDLLPRTKAEFQSEGIWNLQELKREAGTAPPGPPYHIGVPAIGTRQAEYRIAPSVPWDAGAKPLDRFKSLAEAMFAQGERPGAGRKPSLQTTFDNYFRFVWLLSLGAPVDYIDVHPFDLDSSFGIRFFQLGHIGKQAVELVLDSGETLRQRLKLKSPERGKASKFKVFVDSMELRRPIRFSNLKGSESVSTPLLFVGTERPNLEKYDSRRTGGQLEFEGYFLWSHRVIPFDHVGALVRIGDSSGSLFDRTFMDYPVSEQSRREQITCEVFALQGLDAALNIDREYFNRSHPHYHFVARWIHDAFRQFANRHKELGRTARSTKLVLGSATTAAKLTREVKQIVERRTDGESPIRVEFSDDPSLFHKGGEAIILPLNGVLEKLSAAQRVTDKASILAIERQHRIRAVFQVLHAARLLDDLSQRQVEQLAIDLAQVLYSGGDE